MATDANSAIRTGGLRAGLGNVGSYQVSGHPFITGAILASDQQHKISFPYVTKKVTVVASGSITQHLRVHFHTTGSDNLVGHESGGNYISLDSHEDSFEFDVKCKEIYISTAGGATGAYRVYASLTTIPTSSMFALSGSGVTGP
jgi:hypothetical protein